MSLCTCITMPQPPGVDPNHSCVTDYNARNQTNCQNFLTACQACGGGANCERAARDLYLQACLAALYALADCLDAAGIPPPTNGSWYAWVAQQTLA